MGLVYTLNLMTSCIFALKFNASYEQTNLDFIDALSKLMQCIRKIKPR